MTQTYDEFRDALLARHENPATSVLATVGDVVWLAAIPAGLLTRSFRVFLGVFNAGIVVIVSAHFFQPGTVKDEVVEVVSHPIWAVRAETERVRKSLVRTG